MIGLRPDDCRLRPAFGKATDQLQVFAQMTEQWAGALLRVAPEAEGAQKMLKNIFENTAAVGIELSLKTTLF
ncbi:hypothetical protein [Mesorhizobium sp. M0276]|uniref:hypothetical protein n=1 Tax=Mesorhizobium sp. M0276 TaxID=2956928 RepID=UPI00333A47D2